MVDTATRPPNGPAYTDHSADVSFASETQHPLQHSSEQLSPALGHNDAAAAAESRPGWKAFAASAEDVSAVTDKGMNDARTIRSNEPLDVSVDAESHVGTTSLGTIDETTAAGFSTYDRTLAGPSHSGRSESLDYDETSYSYPPTSEETTEAKRVQQNLERWGAEEKMRRKAHRTSKLAAARAPSVSTSYRTTSGGFHELSNGLGSGPSTELLTQHTVASPGTTYSPHARNRTETFEDRRGSNGSIVGRHALQRPSSVSSAESAQSFASFGSDDRPNRKLPAIGSRVPPRTSNGAALSGVREETGNARNPFVDPADTHDSAYSTKPRPLSHKPTPTATRPIVTVGRASSVQRRALENGYTGKGKGKARSMPTIVATDTEPAEATRGLRISGDPFVDDKSFDTETSTTLHQGDDDTAAPHRRQYTGDLGESDLADGIKPTHSRTSLSSSKFREHLDTEDDKARSRSGAEHGEPVQAQRKPWWTDWLCGCGTMYDDDDEQAGRTNPME